MKNNSMELKIQALPINESFARSTVAAFCAQLNPTIEEIGDIKMAVSEAVTNCVVHAYEYKGGDIVIKTNLNKTNIEIIVIDFGKGLLISMLQCSHFLLQGIPMKDLEWDLL
jgi:Anti-sigma regulatory factor (Ser/Thr protein kinase)